jgi:hypothetical protein
MPYHDWSSHNDNGPLDPKGVLTCLVIAGFPIAVVFLSLWALFSWIGI